MRLNRPKLPRSDTSAPHLAAALRPNLPRGRELAATGAAAGALITVPSGNAHALDGVWSLCLAGIDRVTPDNLWQSWSLAPETIVPLATLLAAYCYGLRAKAPPVRQRVAFFAGWAVLAVALISPLCRMAATLVTGHMIQFMLLITAAAILIALARPGAALRAVLPPRSALREALRGMSRPSLQTMTLAYGAAIWLWHAPATYTALLTNAAAHVFGLALLVIISVLFWTAVFAVRPRREMNAIAALLVTMVHTGLLGALLTFGSRPLYPIVAPGALDWGLQPLEDQQIAGLIMWVPGGAVFMVAALMLAFVWLRRMDRARSSVADATGSSP